MTDACIHSIQRMRNKECIRIIVVDNEVNKTGQERSFLLSRWSEQDVCVLQNHGKGGFSEANNLGYRYAREQMDPDFIIAANNDIEFVQQDFVPLLYEAYKKEPCHVMGPYVRRHSTKEPQNPIDVRLRTEEEALYTIRMNRAALRIFPAAYPFLLLQDKRAAAKSLKNKKKAGKEYYGKRRRGVVLFGACLIFTPLFIELEEDAFLPETQFYYEEYLLMLRCVNNGYITMYDPALKVLHESGVSTGEKTGNKRKKMQFVMSHTADACEIYLQEYRRVMNSEKI